MKLFKSAKLQLRLPDPSDHTFLGRMKRLAYEYNHVICAFFVPLLLYWAMYILMGCYPFGNNSVLVLDLNGQYVYFFEALRNALHGDGSLIYSWSRSLGGEFIGLYAYYLASPLSYLVFFFSAEHITEALLLIFLLKCGISGATMAFYLKKNRPAVRDLWVVLFSTMYALSSYMIAYGHNIMWIDALMLFPLVIYGVEQLIKKHRCTLLIVTLALTLMSTFYIGYMVCIFVFFYFFYYYVASSADHGNNYYGEKLHFLKSFIRIGVSAVVSLAISACILLPTYYSLTFGKTTFTDPSWEMTSQFNLIEFFAKMLPGGYDTVRPEGLPFVYCGVLTLLLVPFFFLSKTVKLREKICGALMLSFMVICMENSISDLIWHCFQRPNWLNYRYSFMFIFLLVVFACRGAEDIEQFPKTHLAWIGAGLIGLIVMLQAQKLEFVDTFLCIWLSILLIVAHLGVLTAYLSKRWKQVGTIALSSLVCCEMMISGMLNITSLDKDVVFSTRESYVDQYLYRLSGITEDVQNADTSFYRMEKTLRRTVCDNMAYNIRGLSNSTSTLNASVIRFLADLGYSSESHWSEYLGGNAGADTLLGLKYVIFQEHELKDIPSFYEPFIEDPENKLYAYYNPYALSVAFAANSDINDLDLWTYNLPNYVCPFEAINEIVTSLLGSEETVELFKPIEHSLNIDKENTASEATGTIREMLDENGNPVLDENGEPVKVNTPYYFYSTIGSSNGRLRYSFNVPEDANVYFYFSTEYPRSIDWELENGPSGSMFGEARGYIRSLGKLNGGTNQVLNVTMTSNDGMFYVMREPAIFYYLDEAVFDQVFSKLGEGNFVIDDNYSETHLTGSINVPEDCDTVFTTIPYDEGWNIYVDGEKVELTRTLDALIAFDITPGSHTIEMRYCSKYMIAGFVISIGGLVLGIVLFLIDKFLLRPKLPAMRKAFEVRLAKEEAARLEQEALEQARLAAEAEAAVQAADQPSVNAQSLPTEEKTVDVGDLPNSPSSETSEPTDKAV